ncbi:tryptophan--tRNA ligase [Candidatus Falkowbacteria bacterium]|jgi:tryptophanyl-tRNA synthetase|nr:tryptophan--tRNA ligase [Patescibacteria group bacterium]MDD3435175.1 tryptophan--tRNA ligase [Patescibacteria group bacterium]MDD4466633.1 tryptophan--tRNA ligase [Patescibacteria group bacterium]NCU42905.1 tryptophan--tRNA ligase [Candidatus Falkowbacteria bacterium]
MPFQLKHEQIVFSGIKPSGRLNIGGYIGSLSQWAEMQEKYTCLFCVVDYHAITVKQKPSDLEKWTLELVKTYLAAGVNPKKSILFRQSDLSAHTELAWILNCTAHMADLKKMTQFKEKSLGQKETVSVGLFTYPVLMAADILLHQTDIVPVGEDQKQHVELARDLAKRFNNEYGRVFEIPESVVRKNGARIMSLQDPFKKMSKSENGAGCIDLLEDIEEARKKIRRAVTDSGNQIKYDKKNKPAISNLLTIYSHLSRRSIDEIEKEYEGKGYGDFKKDLEGVVVDFLSAFQKNYNKISDQEALKILEAGRERAEEMAQKTLVKVKKLIGIK